MEGERERRHSGGNYSSGPDRGQKYTGKNSRPYRPSTRGGGVDHRHERSRSGRGKGDYIGSGNGPGRAPVILARADKRPDQPQMIPGAISIMQREAGVGRNALASSIRSSASPSVLQTDSLPPPSTHQHPSTILNQWDELKRPQRSRADGVSSSPSNYTPLQPGTRALARGEGSGGLPRGTSDNFLSQSNEMSHPVKIVDRGLHWEEKGMDFMQEQNDFLAVGVLGKQGVGKSTVMSLLAGTRTGSGKPFMFRTQSKDVWESGSYQTNGIDMIVTGERAILLDTQPVLSESLLEQLSENESMVPQGLSPDAYLEILMAMFLYSVCHVVVLVLDSMESSDIMLTFLKTVEQMKAACIKGSLEMPSEIGDKLYFPQLVFVMNHSSPDDFQPLSLREMHTILATSFKKTKVNIAGGASLAKSGIVPVGRGFPGKKSLKTMDTIDPGEVNLHLLPTNRNITDTYNAFCTTRPEKSENNLNPMFKLLTSYTGHPSFSLLSETLRNQIFSMPRPPILKTNQQQITEREWFDYARRTWLYLKKADLITEYDQILRDTHPE